MNLKGCFLVVILGVAICYLVTRNGTTLVHKSVNKDLNIEASQVAAAEPALVSPNGNENNENYDAGLEPLELKVVDYQKLSDVEVRTRLAGVLERMTQSNLVERANANLLSRSEARYFAALMQDESALKLVLLERKLRNAEENL